MTDAQPENQLRFNNITTSLDEMHAMMLQVARSSTTKDSFLIPLIEDLEDESGGSSFFKNWICGRDTTNFEWKLVKNLRLLSRLMLAIFST